MPTRNQLIQRYQEWDDDRLTSVATAGVDEYTEDAIEAAKDVLLERHAQQPERRKQLVRAFVRAELAREKRRAQKPRPGHLLRRLVALHIDLLFSYAMAVVVCIPALQSETTPSRYVSGARGAFLMLSVGVAWVLGLGYFLLRDALPCGSIGKRLLGLRVVHEGTGVPCSLARSLLRNIVLMVGGCVELLVSIFTEDSRRIGDFLAGTRVVHAGDAGRRQRTQGEQADGEGLGVASAPPSPSS